MPFAAFCGLFLDDPAGSRLGFDRGYFGDENLASRVDGLDFVTWLEPEDPLEMMKIGPGDFNSVAVYRSRFEKKAPSHAWSRA